MQNKSGGLDSIYGRNMMIVQMSDVQFGGSRRASEKEKSISISDSPPKNLIVLFIVGRCMSSGGHCVSSQVIVLSCAIIAYISCNCLHLALALTPTCR